MESVGYRVSDDILWFAGGVWLIGAPAVAIGLDVLILVLAPH